MKKTYQYRKIAQRILCLHISLMICLTITILSSIITVYLQKKINHNAHVLGTTTLLATVNAGTLGLSTTTTSTLSTSTITASSGSSTGNLETLTVTDNRGSGAGWSLTATATDFSCCSGSHTIPVTNLTLNPNNNSLAAVNGASTSNVTAGSSHTFSSTSDSMTIITATSNSGMGQYTINPSVTLTIPIGVYAGQYSATITESLA